MKPCPKCRQVRDPDPAYWWPGNEHESICQDCWEDECSASWWEMVNALNASSNQ